jgi:hypothetical protein
MLLVAGLAARPSTARAQTDQDQALAMALFDEAKSLLAAGKVGDACRKLEESRRIVALPGTVLNLAACHEREGLAASAMAEFREARAMAERDHREDRVAFADEHIRALEPRISMLVIQVGPDADRPDLGIARDGVALGRAAWGTRIPVDPGRHVIEASAPGRVPRRVEVSVGGEGDVQTATVPPLEEIALPAPPPPPPQRAEVPRPPPAGLSAGLSTRRIVALAAGSAGLVGVGLGTYFGATAIAKRNDPNATCTMRPCTVAVDLNNQAGFNADASTVSFALGVAALGVGAFLWFGDSGVHVTPGVGSIAVTARF